MNDNKEIIGRMSTLSNTFKILSGTILGLVISKDVKSNLLLGMLLALFAIMDIYYFYIEKKLRNPNYTKIKALLGAIKSFSIWGYYAGITLIYIIYICLNREI